MHLLSISILSKDMHRPSAAQLWHMPGRAAEPTLPLRLEPLDAQDASYLAASLKISSFSIKSISITRLIYLLNYSTYVRIKQSNIVTANKDFFEGKVGQMSICQ